MKILLLSLVLVFILIPSADAYHGTDGAMTFVTGEQDFSNSENVPIQYIVKNNSDVCILVFNTGIQFVESSLNLLSKNAPTNFTSIESVEIQPDRHYAFEAVMKLNEEDYLPGQYVVGAFAHATFCEGDDPGEGHTPNVYLDGPTMGLQIKAPSNQCIIATATFGSPLAPEVQFLREFRDGVVMSTYSGTNFVTLFNAFYYSWSPYVADSIRDNEDLKSLSRTLITPLLSILTLGSFIQENSDMAMISSGMISSMLIGAVYLTPLGIGSTFVLKKRIRKTHVIYLAIACGIALVFTITATMVLNDIFMMVSSAFLVLSSIALAAVGLTFCFDIVWNHKKKFAT